MQGFELENWAHNFKIENSPKKNLICYTVTQLFKNVHTKKKRIQKEQLICQSRFQRLIFMKTIGKQQSMI